MMLNRMNDCDLSIRIASAIDNAINKNLSPEEEQWVVRIEDLRKSLSYSNEKVEIIDYGAGTPQSKRSEEEMYEGTKWMGIVSNIVKTCSKSQLCALILFQLIKEFKSLVAVELGTCLGISAAYQAAAQKLNEQGKFITLEGSPSFAKLSQNNLQQLGLDNASVITGRFQDNLIGVLENNKPINYVFIDGHHDEFATISYFEQILPYLTPQAVIVFDDIRWSEGMLRTWKTIIATEVKKITVDLKDIGICVIDKNLKDKYIYEL